MRHMLNLYGNCVSSLQSFCVRFITIATAFKKLRENVISPINKQEQFDRGNYTI